MNNFDKQLTQAINTYSELSGKSAQEIRKECTDFESTTSNIIKMMMFAAR